nr:ankyrin repeat and SOCS box protein 2 [Halyomorpha halys]
MRRASVNQYFTVEVNQKIIIYHTIFNKPIMMPLFSAFRLGANLESIKRILQDINDINDGNFNALNEAIRCNCDLEIMEELLYKGININKRDWYGMTPLHFAVTSKKGSLFVPTLLALGADVNAINIVALERGEWINQFKDLQKCKISSGHDSEGREVILNFDCVEKICSYLSNQELQAFSKAFHM